MTHIDPDELINTCAELLADLEMQRDQYATACVWLMLGNLCAFGVAIWAVLA